MTNPADLRIPPHSLEAEQSVLGGLLLDNLAWERMADLLVESDFYRHEHRLIYRAIQTLVTANKPADVITVFEAVQSLSKDADCGGMVYLNALARSVPSASNVRYYAAIVRDHAIKRKLLGALDEIATSVYQPQGRTVEETLGEAESKVLSIGDEGARARQGALSMNQVMIEIIDQVNELAQQGGSAVTGLSTGFTNLDRMTTGFQPGDLILLAARPSMGKTAMVLNMIEHVGVHLKSPVMLFSMEMSAAPLGKRLVSSLGRIDAQRLRTGNLEVDDWGRFAEASERLMQAPIYIDQSTALTHGELRARARRQARQLGGLSLVVIDYLQLMSGTSDSKENRATELGEISRSLKGLAKELNCPVIALSQLNRSLEARTDKRPMMSDLRESGSLEQDADVVMFIYRDDYYTKDASKEPGVAEIIISKQRNGPTGTVRMAFIKALSKFDNLADVGEF
jgi:replicative DNA helicase